jgi:hypothetical protein
MNLAALRTTDLTDRSNPLCISGARTVRVNPRARRALIDEALSAGFRQFRGRQSRFETYTLGCVPDDARAEQLVFDLTTGEVTFSAVEVLA